MKWYGLIGYAPEMVEVEPGYYEEQLVEKPYYGDIIRNTRRLQTSDKINDDINISNQLSIVADPYAINHIFSMRWIEFSGAKWKITDVEVQYPRLILTIGGLWNENKTGTTGDS